MDGPGVVVVAMPGKGNNDAWDAALTESVELEWGPEP